METVNIHQAKTHLSGLLDQAAKGEAFVIAKAGKPLVKVIPLSALPCEEIQRLGFMANQIRVPDDLSRSHDPSWECHPSTGWPRAPTKDRGSEGI